MTHLKMGSPNPVRSPVRISNRILSRFHVTYTLHHFELLMENFNAYNFGRRIYIQNNTYA